MISLNKITGIPVQTEHPITMFQKITVNEAFNYGFNTGCNRALALVEQGASSQGMQLDFTPPAITNPDSEEAIAALIGLAMVNLKSSAGDQYASSVTRDTFSTLILDKSQPGESLFQDLVRNETEGQTFGQEFETVKNLKKTVTNSAFLAKLNQASNTFWNWITGNTTSQTAEIRDFVYFTRLTDGIKQYFEQCISKTSANSETQKATRKLLGKAVKGIEKDKSIPKGAGFKLDNKLSPQEVALLGTLINSSCSEKIPTEVKACLNEAAFKARETIANSGALKPFQTFLNG